MPSGAVQSNITGDDDALALRLNPYARKNTGSYYTPEELVGLIIRRTIQPLLSEQRRDFEATTHRLGSERRPKAERIGELKKVDTAMAHTWTARVRPRDGIGTFPSQPRRLPSGRNSRGDRGAPDIVPWTVEDEPYVSPLVGRLATLRSRIKATAAANHWRVTEEQLDDRHLVRRLILKRCVFGVDKNPMAVELAKLSLWLHSFTVGAPLSFLDHHLRCGDSLFGEWVRPAMDRMAGAGMFVNSAVGVAFGAARGMEQIEANDDADQAETRASASTFEHVKADIGPLTRLLDQLHGIRWVGVEIEQARREVRRLKEEARTALATHGEVAAEVIVARAKPEERKAAALELWLEGKTFGEPLAALDSFYGQVNPPDPAAALLGRAAWVAAEERFFHWEVAFPGVWGDPTSAAPSGGFDAVIGNPPWDRLKLQEVEWFADRKPEIAFEERASDRKRAIAALRDAGDPLWDTYIAVGERAKQAARVANPNTAGSDYPLLGGGDVNLFSLFVERAHRLVRADGIVGLLVPSGIAADKGAAKFFRSVSTSGRLGSLLDFENRLGPEGAFFPDVDSRFKFAAFVTGGRDRRFAAAETGFFLGETDDAALAERTFPLAPDVFARVNPNTGTAPVFRTPDDARIVSDIYARVPILVDHRTDPPTQDWPVKYSTMFHMTNDADKFRTAAELERDGWYRVAGSAQYANGNRRALPLYVGRMFRHFDHRVANVRVNLENLHNPAVSEPTNDIDKADPAFTLSPQFYVEEAEIEDARAWSLAFRDIARVTDERTIIASIVPAAAFGNTSPLLTGLDAPSAALLVANLNSLALDFVARRKSRAHMLTGISLSSFPS